MLNPPKLKIYFSGLSLRQESPVCQTVQCPCRIINYLPLALSDKISSSGSSRACMPPASVSFSEQSLLLFYCSAVTTLSRQPCNGCSVRLHGRISLLIGYAPV